MEATYSQGGHELTAERDMIEVTSMSPDYEPDRTWSHIDGNGHTHTWVGHRLPTLVSKHEDWIDADGDSRTDSWWECEECGEEIRPGYKEVPGTGPGFRRFIPGPTRYYLDGQPITEAEAQAFLNPPDAP